MDIGCVIPTVGDMFRHRHAPKKSELQATPLQMARAYAALATGRLPARIEAPLPYARGQLERTRHALTTTVEHTEGSGTQARVEGLYTHGMAGIDKAGIAQYLNLDPDQDKVIMGFTIGRMGDPGNLEAGLREREIPSPRLPLDEIWLGGKD